MFLLILFHTNPIDTLLRTIFHISSNSLKFLSSMDCEFNEIKGIRPSNCAQSSLDAQDEMLGELSSTIIQIFCLQF